jgi:hypothetical protein
MFRRRFVDCIEGERKPKLITECKGEGNTLGPIHLDTSSPAPAFYSMGVILDFIRFCGEISIRGKDALVVSECC